MNGLPDLKRAVRMAYRVLAAREIRTLPVEPLLLLRACRNTVVMTAEEAADTCGVPLTAFDREFAEADAFTLCRRTERDEQYIVVYRPGGNPARLRFTLAHELGHRVLGHVGTGDAQEREADCFASHLLCPEPVIRGLRKRFGELSAEQVAAACYVSLSCARAIGLRNDELVDEMWAKRVSALLKEAVERVVVVASHQRVHLLRAKDE